MAGGTGTRLHPLTLAVSKQLMPVYDKPMIYYPLSTLMLAGIREILIITTPEDQAAFQKLLGDGSQLGCTFEYVAQPSPDGLAQAFILGEKFIDGDHVALILGDNIFYGTDLGKRLKTVVPSKGATIFAYEVSDPSRYGVIEFDDQMRVLSIEEKPDEPKSKYMIPGLYFYDASVVDIAKSIRPSARGELEITDVHKQYLQEKNLHVCVLDRGSAWFDTGTFDSLQEASQFIEVIEKRQGVLVGGIEEIAYQNGWIDEAQLRHLAAPLLKSGYGRRLLSILD